MTKKDFIELLSKNLGVVPTQGQLLLFGHLTDYFSSDDFRSIYLISGYAGTGKTSIVRTLVSTLSTTRLKTVLLAPTGRAAKVLANYSGKSAFTIHKKIYFTQSTEFGMHFSLQQNLHKRTVFIVDEASMIGGENAENEHNLLSDLIQYVASGEQCRLILIGDTAQLPPVGLAESPAMNKKQLEQNYYIHIAESKLYEVMRQRLESGILFNATTIRDQLESGEKLFPRLVTSEFNDVKSITGEELEDCLTNAYSKYGTEEVLVITRSNKTANLYNRQIRARIRWQEDEISAGDFLMVVKNNYFWLAEDKGPGFIANGDTLEISRLGKFYERGEFKFVDAQVRLLDYPEEPELEVKLLLNTLSSEQANVSYQDQKKLFSLIEEDYAHIPTKRERMKLIKKDPFLNALQVKFAYAVTCHKAQGGQWKCVFVDQGYLTEEMLDINYLRWLYTAITRASEHLYLINFNKLFFEDGPE